MTSICSPTGLYSGGLRWVDPPGAAAGSVKPRDRAGPGPLGLVGGHRRCHRRCVVGSSRSWRHTRFGVAAGPAGGVGTGPGLARRGPGLSPVGASAGLGRESISGAGTRRPTGAPVPPRRMGRRSRAGQDRISRDGTRRPGQTGRPRQAGSTGTGQGSRRGARRPVPAGPTETGHDDRRGARRSGLGKAAGAGRPYRGSCADGRCGGARRDV